MVEISHKLLEWGFFGAVIIGTFETSIPAMILFIVLRRLRPNLKNQLAISCVIITLIFLGFIEFVIGHLMLMPTLSYVASGFLAFLILRLLFKTEIESAQAKNQEMTEEENKAVPQ